MALADALLDRLDNRRDVAVPNHMAEMFTFLYGPHTAEETPLLDEIPTPVAAEPGLDDHNI